MVNLLKFISRPGRINNNLDFSNNVASGTIGTKMPKYVGRWTLGPKYVGSGTLGPKNVGSGTLK